MDKNTAIKLNLARPCHIASQSLQQSQVGILQFGSSKVKQEQHSSLPHHYTSNLRPTAVSWAINQEGANQ